MIKEGDIGTKAYLIKEGECTVFSTRNPLEDGLDTKSDWKERKTDLEIRTKRGYLSQKTNTFQFGTLQKNQWVGEERLIKQEVEPFGYSIVARTNIVAFEILKAEAQKKFTKELMEFIGQGVKQRYLWIADRVNYLVKISTAVARLDPLSAKYDENLLTAKKKFPTASKSVLTNIRKQVLLAKNLSVAKSNFEKSPKLSNSASLPSVKQISPVKYSTVKVEKYRREDKKKVSTLSMKRSNLSMERIVGQISTTNVSTERLLRVQEKFQTDMASSAQAFWDNNYGVVPMYSKPLYKSRVADISFNKTHGAKERASSNIRLGEKHDSQKKFTIGIRSIILVNNEINRPRTPNPFNVINAKMSKDK